MFGDCGTGKNAFMAASRPTEVLLSDEMDGENTLKSGIPSFCYLVPAKNGREEAVPRDFPVYLKCFNSLQLDFNI